MTRHQEIPKWTLTKKQTLLDCRIFQVESWSMEREQALSASAEFHVIRCPDWVNIVALTSDDQIILIEQYRIGVERQTLEIPGGMIDPGETPEQAAARELREETGYAARQWFALGSIEPNPAIQSNRCFTFLALGAEKTHDTSFDHHEWCRTLVEPFSEIPRHIAQGRITHALVVVALQFELLRRQGVLPAKPVIRGELP